MPGRLSDSERKRLQAEINEHPGTAAHDTWGGLRRVVDLHFRNVRSLLGYLQDVQGNPIMLMNITGENSKPGGVREEFVAELDRRLHNMLASAVTLIDHARIALSKYAETAFGVEFQTRNSLIRADPRTQFLRSLRNYMLHFRVLTFRSRTSWNFGDSPGLTGQILLDSRILRLNKSWWSATAMQYLDANTQGIDTVQLVDWYREASADLWTWAFGESDRMHSVDIAEVNDLVRAFNDAVEPKFE